ncbi:MAG: hypothetical protein E7329_00675 [Clostridiales bacterium]|nr:hypothetical protein [Clostridiales bacterium]
MRDMVLVLNFDDAASRAVARKLRSERVFCKIVPGDISLEEIRDQSPLGLLLAGGVSGEAPIGMDGRILQSGLPLLALGDTSVLLLTALGGTVGEIAVENTVLTLSNGKSPLLEDVEEGERLLPCARVMTLPQTVQPICWADDLLIGFAHEILPLYGLQIEVEANDPEGTLLLRNFALTICGCTTWWDEDSFVARAVEEINRVVGDGTAVCAMTGGLDSGVSALLAFKALGHRLKCIFVDTGLLRDREGDDFISFYRDAIGLDIIRVHAQGRFLEALRGITDPDEKRRAIGLTMQEILSEEKEKLGHFDALIRGTSYNDIMFGKGDRRPALSDAVPVIEPVRELFKDEIRRVGDYLGLPQDILSRQPFPGSGLALRILGEVTQERLATLRAVDSIFRNELVSSGMAKRLWQYFAVLSPMPGDEKGVVVSLRAVHASENSLAYAARLPFDVLETVVDQVRQSRPEVRRVVYDLTPSSNYAGIEWQ